jgi:hypothetical protein
VSDGTLVNKVLPFDGMATSVVTSPRLALAASRVDRAVKNFAQGVGNMAEIGNGTDVAALIEQLTKALKEKSDAYATVTVKPKLPAWVVNILVGLTVSVAMSLGGGLVAYGQLTNRVANLENAHPEGIAALTVEVHMMTEQLADLQKRFNEFSDQQRHGR